jgi:hypothetical protein
VQVSTAFIASCADSPWHSTRGAAQVEHGDVGLACSVDELHDDIKLTYVASLHQLCQSIVSIDARLPANNAQTVGLPDDLMVAVNEDPEQEFAELLRALHPYLDELSGAPCALAVS